MLSCFWSRLPQAGRAGSSISLLWRFDDNALWNILTRTFYLIGFLSINSEIFSIYPGVIFLPRLLPLLLRFILLFPLEPPIHHLDPSDFPPPAPASLGNPPILPLLPISAPFTPPSSLPSSPPPSLHSSGLQLPLHVMLYLT